MAFGENLHRVYRDCYDMVKDLGFTPEYVDGLSPADRGIYLMYYKKDQEEAAKRRKQNPGGLPIGAMGEGIEG